MNDLRASIRISPQKHGRRWPRDGIGRSSWFPRSSYRWVRWVGTQLILRLNLAIGRCELKSCYHNHHAVLMNQTNLLTFPKPVVGLHAAWDLSASSHWPVYARGFRDRIRSSIACPIDHVCCSSSAAWSITITLQISVRPEGQQSIDVPLSTLCHYRRLRGIRVCGLVLFQVKVTTDATSTYDASICDARNTPRW